jgi:hypothetical protein
MTFNIISRLPAYHVKQYEEEFLMRFRPQLRLSIASLFSLVFSLKPAFAQVNTIGPSIDGVWRLIVITIAIGLGRILGKMSSPDGSE